MIRAHSGKSVKIYSWQPGMSLGGLYLFGPTSLGGKGDLRVLAEDEMKRTGKSYDEAIMEVRI